MTNKQTIDGVPSEQVERALDAIEQVGLQDKFIDYTFVRTVKHELRALLDAPAQPQGEIEDERGEALSIYDDAMDACAEVERSSVPGDVIREMNDELADLRAQLAERDAALKAIREACDNENSHGYIDMLAEDALSISAEPKPRGEPVAVEPAPIDYGSLDAVQRLELCRGDKPAPVAVALPERKPDASWLDYDTGWNACVDEVTRLNTK